MCISCMPVSPICMRESDEYDQFICIMGYTKFILVLQNVWQQRPGLSYSIFSSAQAKNFHYYVQTDLLS